MSNPVGRPTLYKPEIIEKAREYFLTGWMKDEIVPTIEGLALALGIQRETIYAWEQDEGKEEFSDIVGDIRSLQGKKLIIGGLNKDFSPQIAALMLAKHGYKNEVDVTSGNKPIPIFGNVSIDDGDKEDSGTQKAD